MARVNIIIPVYNSEKYLNRCLNSVINQTFNDYEIIIVNDGSTDNSLRIINDFKEKYKGKVKIINQANQGVQKARMNAFCKSNAEYICFVDSDDYIEKNYIGELYKTIKDTSTNICCSRFKMHFNKKWLEKIPFSDRKKPKTINLLLQKEYLPTINVVSTAKMFKRDFIKFPANIFEANEDLSINYCNFAMANNISNADNTAYHYHPNSNGLVSKKINGNISENLKNTIEPLKELKNNFIKMNIYEKYNLELESIFIKNLFERISYIYKNIKNQDQKNKLIKSIFDFLYINFPNWENNPYYKKNFNNFELTDISNVLYVKSIIKKI